MPCPRPSSTTWARSRNTRRNVVRGVRIVERNRASTLVVDIHQKCGDSVAAVELVAHFVKTRDRTGRLLAFIVPAQPVIVTSLLVVVEKPFVRRHVLTSGPIGMTSFDSGELTFRSRPDRYQQVLVRSTSAALSNRPRTVAACLFIETDLQQQVCEDAAGRADGGGYRTCIGDCEFACSRNIDCGKRRRPHLGQLPCRFAEFVCFIVYSGDEVGRGQPISKRSSRCDCCHVPSPLAQAIPRGSADAADQVVEFCVHRCKTGGDIDQCSRIPSANLRDRSAHRRSAFRRMS